MIERLEPSHIKKSKHRRKQQVRPAEPTHAHRPGDYACRRRKSRRSRRRDKSFLYRLHDVVDDVFDLDDLLDFFD
ncbi:MAG: hypothetical protein AAGE80_04085 [Pseudomonadota bacterium]